MTETDFILQDDLEFYLASDDETEKSRNKSSDNKIIDYTHKDSIGTDHSYKHEVVWRNAIGFLILHILAVYGFLRACIGSCKLYTVVWGK